MLLLRANFKSDRLEGFGVLCFLKRFTKNIGKCSKVPLN